MVARIIEFCAAQPARRPPRRRLRHRRGAVVSIRHVKLDAIPDLSDPQVIVFTEWMGRSPTLVEDQVTYPIVVARCSARRTSPTCAATRCSGCRSSTSSSRRAPTSYWARSRVLEYMNGHPRHACPRASTRRSGPTRPGIGWVFQYALVDKTGQHDLDELRTFQDFTLRYALGSVPGVAEVASVGGYQKQYQVTVDPNRLRAYGVTLDEVIDAIRDSNNDVGGRILEMSGREYYVRGRGYIAGPRRDRAHRGAGAAAPSGTPVLVKDVGDGPLRPRHPARRCSSGTARARRWAASWSCATARTRSTSSSA